jgi:hypothetical protein
VGAFITNITTTKQKYHFLQVRQSAKQQQRSLEFFDARVGMRNSWCDVSAKSSANTLAMVRRKRLQSCFSSNRERRKTTMKKTKSEDAVAVSRRTAAMGLERVYLLLEGARPWTQLSWYGISSCCTCQCTMPQWTEFSPVRVFVRKDCSSSKHVCMPTGHIFYK